MTVIAGAPRLHGRDSELEILQSALQEARRRAQRVVWLSGEAGVGKSALVRALQPLVLNARGRVAAGKCEQFGAGEVLQAPRQALRQLLATLAAAAPAPSATLRDNLRRALGPDGPTLLRLLPELEAITGALPAWAAQDSPIPPQRLISVLVGLVRVLAGALRPLVLVLDDLHWADPLTLELLEALLEAQDLQGLLLIGLFRPSEPSPEPPAEPTLARLLQRAADGAQPPLHLELANLSGGEVNALLADLLHREATGLRQLSASILRQSDGNPFFVIQLVQGLQRDGLLRQQPERQGWHWQGEGADPCGGQRSVLEFLAARLARLPAPCRALLQILGCLGSQASLELLGEASGMAAETLAAQLEPALQEGVLVLQPPAAQPHGAPTAVVGFSHDRLQQAALAQADGGNPEALHLAVARRLLAAGRRMLAARHFAAAGGLLESAHERQRVADLLEEAGDAALAAAAFGRAERFHLQAWELLGSHPFREHPAQALRLKVALHQAAYGQADHRRSDRLYAELQARAGHARDLLDATAIQVMALSNRGRYREAVDLAAGLLEQLGVCLPAAPEAAVGAELSAVEEAVRQGDLERLPPLQPSAPRGDSVARLMSRLVPAAFFCNPPLACWLVLRSTRQWLAGDAHPGRIYPLACTLLASVPLRQDYATGYRCARAALAIGEASEQGVETARTRHVFSLFCGHWFEPLEAALAQARQAHQDLRRSGEQEFACYTFFTTQAALLEAGSSLQELAEENRRAMGFARSNGNRHALLAYGAFNDLVAALRPGSAMEPGPQSCAEELAQANPMAACFSHTYQALVACLQNDTAAMGRHAEAASRLEPYITGFYPVVLIRLLLALGLIHAPLGPQAEARRQRLDALEAWFAARSEGAPQNLAHLAQLIRAERLASEGRALEALEQHERAMRGAIAHQRPWHAALATERAGRCYLALGLEQAGQRLIEQAHHRYGRWGAAGVTARLEREFPFLRAGIARAADGHDLMEAIRGLSMQRTVPQLAQASAEVIGELTGATDVQIVALNAEGQWRLKGGLGPGGPLKHQSLGQAEALGLLPASALRLSLRLLEPLVCNDAVLDPRFAADPYLDGLTCCSLLVVPVVVQQRPIAVVLASHRTMRGAFVAEQVRAVEQVCSHLNVALENLLIQRSLEQQVEERSQELREAQGREARNEEQRRLVLEQKLRTSLRAAAVVHEIQQPLSAIVLNCHLAVQSLEAMPSATVASELVEQLRQLIGAGDQLTTTMERIRMLLRNVETEHTSLDLAASLHSALVYLRSDLQEQGVQLQTAGLERPWPFQGDGAQLQIAVVNLVRNALQAMAAQPAASRRLAVTLEGGETGVRIRIADSGPGFPVDVPMAGDSPAGLTDPGRGGGRSRAGGRALGIGLFLAETAAINHHGRLHLGRSAALGGAEVKLELARTPPSAASDQPARCPR